MKKYLTFAAILGVIALISVSYLAQAEEKAEAPAPAAAMEAAAPAAAMEAAAPAAPALPDPTKAEAVAPSMAAPAAQSSFKVDSDICNMLASAPTTEGAAPAQAAHDEAFKKCMIGKGHTEEELKNGEGAQKEQAIEPKADAPAEKKE